jgi:peptide/nickel transport system ATP-binding protein
VPKPDPGLRAQRVVLEGEVADAAHLPVGCAFHPRCRFAVDPRRAETPMLRPIAPAHLVRCHRAEELALVGIGATGTM